MEVGGSILHFPSSILHPGSSALPDGRFFAIQTKRQTLGASPRLEEFVQFDRDGLVTPFPKRFSKPFTPGIGHYGLPHHHGIASEAVRFILMNRQQALDIRFDDFLPVRVKSSRKVDRLSG